MSAAVSLWNEKLAAMKANRDDRFGRTPKDDALEDRLLGEMQAIFETLTPRSKPWSSDRFRRDIARVSLLKINTVA